MSKLTKANNESGRSTLYISAVDSAAWADKPGAVWPCSQLAGKRIRVEFDASGDMVDYAINGRSLSQWTEGWEEFDAIVCDFLHKHDPKHPGIRDRDQIGGKP